MLLADLDSETKEAIAEYRANNHSIPETYSWWRVNYPHNRSYSASQVEKWFYGPEGKEMYSKALEGARTAARNQSFANKDSRLLAYVEVSEKILHKLRNMAADNPKFSPLSRELRENFKCIKDEVDPFDINDEATSSAFDRLINRTAGTPWEKILKSQLPGQTLPTSDN